MIVGPILSKEADLGAVTKKDDVRSMAHVESFCATEETAELWSVEYELGKQRDGDVVKQGGVYLDYEVVRILAIAFEMKRSKSGKDNPGEQGRVSACGLCVGLRSRGLEPEKEYLEVNVCNGEFIRKADIMRVEVGETIRV